MPVVTSAVIGGVATVTSAIMSGILSKKERRRQDRQSAKAASQQRRDWESEQAYQKRTAAADSAMRRGESMFNQRMMKEQINKETLSNAFNTVNTVAGNNLEFNNYLKGMF